MDLEHLKEFLECSVCFEQLNESSRVLPCQHTFCLQCLENLINDGIIKCPECRAVYSGTLVNNLPRNVLLIRILDGMKQDKYLVENTEDLKGGSDKTCKLTNNLQELSNELEFLPHGKALFDFAAPENEDVPFKAGDLIFLLQKAYNDWYEGLVNGIRGLVPANYIEIVVPIPSINDDSITASFVLALYNFDDPSEEVLSFKQGDIIHVLKVVDGDPNWGEGLLGNQYGIFPFNYTKLNDCVSKMLTLNSNKDDSHVYTNDKSNSTLSPWVKLTDVKKRHTIHVENPNEHATSVDAAQAPQRNRRTSRGRDTRRSSGPLLESSSSELLPNVTQRSVSERRLFSASGSDGPRNNNNNNNKTDINYIALYNYPPSNDDEIALVKGQFYTVIANYENGWSKGIDPQTAKTGLFPSNYVKLVMNISQPARTRSGSQPIEPTTNICVNETIHKQVSILSAIRKRTTKRQAPSPPPYSVLPVSSAGNTSGQQQPKPLPNLPVEPPPPYSPQQPPSGVSSFQRTGQLPQAVSNKERCRVIADYPPTENDELELKVGDIVVVKKKSSNGWYKGTCLRNGLTGLFPSSFVELIRFAV